MAYMNQERKAVIANALKPIFKKYGVKGTLSVQNHSTIVLTLKSGKIDYQVSRGFRANTQGYDQVNPYWFQDHYDGDAKAFLTDAFKALKSAGWYDNSDAMTDYFDTAYYTDINIGKWNKNYVVEA
jgi:hypothetical protein